MFITVINPLALAPIFFFQFICLCVCLLCIKGGGTHDLKKQKFKAQARKIRGGGQSVSPGCWDRAGWPQEPGGALRPGIGEALIIQERPDVGGTPWG